MVYLSYYLSMNHRTPISNPSFPQAYRKRKTAVKVWLWVWMWLWMGSETMGECPKVCECKWKDGKETVSCPDAEFIDIPRRLDPSTQVLDLKRNNLQILPRDAFVDTGLVNLQKVWLTHCKLKHIDRGAFNKLANLVELDLSHNMLRSVPSSALTDVSGLRDLRLANNNLTTLPGEAFTPVPDLVRLDISDNQIDEVNEKAFRGLTRLEVLKLAGNRFTTLLSSVVLPLVAIHELHLEANPWDCDCVLRPLRQWMIDRNVAFAAPPICSLPPRLKGRHWQILTLDEFVCEPKVTAVAPRVLAAHGENVTLACRVEKDTDVIVTWFMGERLIRNATESKRYKILEQVTPNSLTRVSNLTIAGAALQDQGTYRCVVENKAGIVETNLTLQVSDEIAEVRLVTMDRVFVTGGLLSAVVVIVIVLLLLTAVIFRKRQQSRRRGHEIDHKIETPQSSQGQGSNASDSHPKLSEYHIVPTNDIDDASPLPTHSDKSWMLRDASVDDFPSTKDMEKSALYAEADQRRLQKPIQDRSGQQPSPSTVSYVEIPKSEMAATQETLEDRLRWKDQSCDSKDNLLRQGCSQAGSQLSMGSGGPYPDLLDLPYTQQQSQLLQDERSHTLQLLNPAYCTMPRSPRVAYDGRPHQTSVTAEDVGLTETSFSRLTGDRYRSASALNLALNEASQSSNSSNYDHPPIRHQHSLPDTAPILQATEATLRNLMAARRPDFAGEGGAVGGSDLDATDACRFQYHAQQLEKFLLEYRSLQEQLYRMKESYEAQHRRSGSMSRIDTIPESDSDIGAIALPPRQDPPPPSNTPYTPPDPGLPQGGLLGPTEPLRSILKKRYEDGARGRQGPYSRSAYFGDELEILRPTFGLPVKKFPDRES
ncbi:uncharacterized protein LOC135207962 isoform X1 [Macrobrachium nipponense]|uniref:uncharacterized protein LOC135207962 isoform X1 n=1 Tax=Macrobrachium nipponense TaxID=159736 RepID=UPI0030C814B1